ncbi:NAD(P)/FAD-dependent oxidoreductase [Secundilactobacillus kimchicus]|uniref:NAD(P)/FAD-dependent oxidoreductase n=1 Tax=Secundilactobacillus kimchicus TaxID=528209 RepID=UPI0024A86FD9|nr:NAD(P)/FAD-dependent oxidoreductase [Secundilactobacillus kimchicus]
MNDQHSIVIIGAGPAGIGLGVALQNYGINDFLILEKETIGHSFESWNPETHFISPSFTTNGFGAPDLNAITPDTSPAYSISSEHPSGKAYASYLRAVSKLSHLPVLQHTGVDRIVPVEDHFELILSSSQILEAQYVFVGIGDFSYPYRPDIPGNNYGIHYADIQTYNHFSDQMQTVIGGNEAGFDVAINLAKRGIPTTIYTTESGLESKAADPSKRLSTFTIGRYLKYADLIHVESHKQLVAIKKKPTAFKLTFADSSTAISQTKPIFATGFAASQSPLVSSLFDIRANRPLLTAMDESTKSPNVFLIGPQVTHDDVVLCYIYKYRQRFAPLAEELLARLRMTVNPQVTQQYKKANMFLDDFEDCDVNCQC